MDNNGWRSRIIGEDMVDAKALVPNPLNWRQHPEHQRSALQGVLDSVGWVQRVIVNKRTGNTVDGHLRRDMAAQRGEKIQVLYVDLSEDEERLVLATLDPIAGLATMDHEILSKLLADMETDNAAIGNLLESLQVPAVDVGDLDASGEWSGMPEFNQPDVTSFRKLIVHFRNAEDVEEFSSRIGQALTENTISIWHPKQDWMDTGSRRYEDEGSPSQEQP